MELFPRNALCRACNENFTSEEVYTQGSPARGPSECFLCAAVSEAKSCLNKCLSSHEKCRKEQKSPLPARVLNVGSRDPFLQVAMHPPSQTGDYVALSYCWGTSKPFLTTKPSLQDRQQGIPMSSLPKTIRDATWFTRKMGISYLWVDSLCILQGSDDESRADWLEQSAIMDQIYGNALFTLVAGASTDCDEGIFRLSFLWKFDSEAVSSIEHSVTDQPIFRRAWTLQERIFSWRRLEFWTFGLAWQCKGSRNMNAETSQQLSDDRGQRMVSYDPFDGRPLSSAWAQLVQDYSRRAMTRSEDKLLAISALAKKYEAFTGDEYLAGIWRSSILYQLAWRVDKIPLLSWSRISRPPVYRAPSWSWASVDGLIWLVLCLPHLKSFSEVVECCINPAFDDPFGLVKGGKLVVDGPILQIQVSGPRQDFTYERNMNMTDGITALGPVWLDPDDQGVFGKVIPDQHYALLLAGSTSDHIVLVLSCLEGSDGFYIRKGVGNIITERNVWFHTMESRKTTIL
jgi:hypothetical protein